LHIRESISPQSLWRDGFRVQPCGLPRNDERLFDN
jgi:hypothetical protein